MSISHLHQAREALNSALGEIDFPDSEGREALKREIVLRPPKKRSWGDLSTNAAILLKSNKIINFDEALERVLSGFKSLEGIADVRYEGNGYINLRYQVDYWLNQVPLILEEGVNYGLMGLAAEKCVISVPTDVIDLMSCRQQSNAVTLERLAALIGAGTERNILPLREASGFSLASAIGKCTEAKVRFALIANSPDFIDAFSPILAIDKSYDNPVFAIPYACMMLDKIMVKTEIQNGVDMSVLKLPIEVELARVISGWPLAVERTLKKRDGFYLVSFLHELSLLFFRHFDRVHPISSNYLTEAPEQPARLALLSALGALLNGGAILLGVDTVKEYA